MDASQPNYESLSDGQLKEIIQKAWEELQDREVLPPGPGLQQLLDEAGDKAGTLAAAIDSQLYKWGYNRQDEEEAEKLRDTLHWAAGALAT